MIKKGKGWRIGWQEKISTYQGLIGAEDWAMELTTAEMQDFCRLLLQIHQGMADMTKHLMEEEIIICEAESDLMWLGAEGYPHNYSLRIILHHHRGCEGTWSENVTQDLIQATQSLKLF
ncbi:hypothetical protein GM3708_1182 [Geminocystis sp. NIES-3708]|uniref:DUF1818 family protein n=1 Tax=Geminocystis sp. NIES-3708 TaxID=1615909 RepID=UPI0005FC7C97|nr:DUF1818 family protein [Geminocystis sp. NIES-3708]BAQ60776.1 hypothetical protein GM3708_1182 [Geminocystis sp. NIES-3708]